MMIILTIKLIIYKNMRTYIYSKGYHLLEVVELGDQARVKGLNGWLDTIELMSLLLENGYNFIR